MPRYRTNARFGPWRPGDEFESEDDLHASLAAEGLVSVVEEGHGPPDLPPLEPQTGAWPPGAGGQVDRPPTWAR